MRRSVLGLALLGVVLAGTPLVAGADDPLECGDTIRHDTTLTEDLVDCGSVGLIIGADGITLDLNGHRISGVSLFGTEEEGSVGVKVKGRDHVTIKGDGSEFSRVEGFETAVKLSRADGNRIEGARIQGRDFGVQLYDSDDNVIEGNGIAFAGGEYPQPCKRWADAAIAVFKSHDNRIAGNTAQLGLFGIQLVDSDHNEIEDNEAAPSWSDGNICEGIALFDSHSNRLAGNTVANNVAGGILVDSGSRYNTVESNIAYQNGDEGIDVKQRRATIRDNQADNNYGHGIKGVNGVKDGGGNGASGNFTDPQCLFVDCS